MQNHIAFADFIVICDSTADFDVKDPVAAQVNLAMRVKVSARCTVTPEHGVNDLRLRFLLCLAEFFEATQIHGNRDTVGVDRKNILNNVAFAVQAYNRSAQLYCLVVILRHRNPAVVFLVQPNLVERYIGHVIHSSHKKYTPSCYFLLVAFLSVFLAYSACKASCRSRSFAFSSADSLPAK